MRRPSRRQQTQNAISPPSALEASIHCGNIATWRGAQTSVARGPAGSSAVLKVYSENENDHGSCGAEYELLVLPANGGTPGASQLMSSVADWGRTLSVHLDGFSQDGKRVFGILSEGGKYSFTKLFDEDIASGTVPRFPTTGVALKFVELTKYLTRLRAIKCGATFAVAGTTETGAIVIEPNTTNNCRSNYHWLLDPKTGHPQLLPQGKPIVGLYNTHTP